MKNNRFLYSFAMLGLLFLFQAGSLSAATDHKKIGDQLLVHSKPLLAINEYQEALKSSPDSTAVLFNLAIAYYSVRQIDNTISTLESLIALNGADVEAKYNLGCLLLYKGNLEKAELLYREAKEDCSKESPFLPRLNRGLELIKNLKNADRSTQDLLRLATQHGLPPQSLA